MIQRLQACDICQQPATPGAVLCEGSRRKRQHLTNVVQVGMFRDVVREHDINLK